MGRKWYPIFLAIPTRFHSTQKIRMMLRTFEVLMSVGGGVHPSWGGGGYTHFGGGVHFSPQRDISNFNSGLVDSAWPETPKNEQKIWLWHSMGKCQPAKVIFSWKPWKMTFCSVFCKIWFPAAKRDVFSFICCHCASFKPLISVLGPKKKFRSPNIGLCPNLGPQFVVVRRCISKYVRWNWNMTTAFERPWKCESFEPSVTMLRLVASDLWTAQCRKNEKFAMFNFRAP